MTPRPELRDQARGRWRSILPKLGVAAKALDGKQHPCPVCAGKDRFRFDDLEGNGTWFCNQCGAGNGMSLARAVTGLPFAEMAAKVREMLPDATFAPSKPARDDAKCKDAMREVWARSVPIAGTMAESYLRSRGLSGPWPAHLRFVDHLRATKHEARFLPAMVAKVSDKFGQGVNIHRTFLVDGRKAYRAMMPGAVPDGAAIRLTGSNPHLGIAEGIETALHAARKFGTPCWAAIDANHLEKWEPPTGVEQVSIFGDHDESYTGQAAAFVLAKRLTNRREPITSSVILPPRVGTDWADLADEQATA
jgi:putative DNA primase/helicase